MTKKKTKKLPRRTHVTRANASRRVEKIEAILQAAYDHCIPRRRCRITTVAFHLDVGYPTVRQWVTRGVPDEHVKKLSVLSGFTEGEIRAARNS